VEIVARKARLAATALDGSTEVGFIRRLVVGESDVAVDAEQAVARREPGDARILLLKRIDQQLYEVTEVDPRRFVGNAVAVEPGLLLFFLSCERKRRVCGSIMKRF
jgi:hypothetical protein